MSEHHLPAPVRTRYLTRGTWVGVGILGIGLSMMLIRFLFGLETVTNLDNQHPWGLWIAVDIATGVALAAGGFTSAALVYIFRREHYHAITRPALLTALLGYTFVVIGLLADLGRPYNVWHPMMPNMWSPNSVLFEVGICVMIYLSVLYVEFLPIVCTRLQKVNRFPRLARISCALNSVLGKTMFLFVIAGVVLSCAHQSSLGALLVIAPSKVHPLWWTPILPLLFLLSAIAVGFPMVIFESLLASRSLGLKPEMNVLTPLSKFIPALLGIYLAVKVTDMLIRESYVYLGEMSTQSIAFILEVLLGVVTPIVILLTERGRTSVRWLMTASALVVVGVAANRINVFLTAFQPKSAQTSYFPAFGEFAVTIGLVAGLVLCYRAIVTNLPVIAHADEEEAGHVRHVA